MAVEPADREQFTQRFEAIAPTMGWYPRRVERQKTGVVISTSELGLLQAMAQDPLRYNKGTDMTPQAPPAPTLVSVQLATNANTLRHKLIK